MGSGAIPEPRGHVPLPSAAAEHSIPERLFEAVRVHGERAAIVDEAGTVSYVELDAWSDDIAQELRRHTRGRDVPVALAMRQGRVNIAATIGALKAGCAYVPVDPLDPASARWAREIGVAIALTDDGVDGRAIGQLPRFSGNRPPRARGRVEPSSADSVAYIFATSGSTGERKPVFDSHRNVIHNVLRYTNTLCISPEDRMSLVQAPTFSGTVSTVFSALLNGASLYPLPVAASGIARLAELVERDRLTMLHFVPSVLRALVRTGASFPSVRLVRLEGDAASASDVGRFRLAFSETARLVNGFGATETGLARQFIVAPDTVVPPGPLPIGYPVPGVEALIVDRAGDPVETGDTGRIAFVGRHLALGYWGRPDLSSEAFRQLSEGRMYLSGDVGFLTEDGCLTHVGRIDHVRRARGPWVDTTAIVGLLEAHDAVDAAFVAAAPDSRTLTAWIVPKAGRSHSTAALQRHLALALPPSRVPSHIVVVEELPLTDHGKVDVPALRPPESHARDVGRPLSELEQRLVRVWEEVLETEPVGVDQNFFDLGGDSLAACEVIAWIEAELGLPLSATVLGDAPTIEGLAALLGGGTGGPKPVELLADRHGPPLFFLHDWDGNIGLYRELAGRLRSGPVWGVRQSVVPPSGTTFTARASEAIVAIRSIQPDGAYRIGGHCFGAVLAFEVAQQLATQGSDVDLLALLGISPWDFPRVSRAAWRRYADALGYPGLTTRAGRALPSARSRGVLRTTARAARALPTVLRHSRVRAGERPRTLHRDPLREGNADAFRRYRAERYPGTALVILGAETTALYTEDPQSTWSALAHDVVTHVVPGSDISMLRFPGAIETAGIIDAAVSSPSRAGAQP